MEKTVKIFAAIALVITMLMAMTACAVRANAITENKETKEENMLPGGWQGSDSMEITDEIREMVEQATTNMIGANYTPVAYIGRQIVNGTNHKILVKIAPVTPDATETYAIVTIYEDLQGNVEMKEILNCDAEVVQGSPMGGWQDMVPAKTEASEKALADAAAKMAGAEYKEVCCLRTQIVNGTNYCLLCEITPVVPNAESHFAIVTVYADLEGNAQITEVFDFFTA